MTGKENSHQSEIFKLMHKPEFYAHPVQSVEVCETHISMVFLTGAVVYKFKKSVDMDFLDFTTLKKRRYFCEKEVELNRRLTHDVYQGVVAITRKNGHYEFQGDGKPVEYAVKMQQLPDNSSMLRMLKKDRFDSASVHELARVLIHFYRNAPMNTDINAFGTWPVIRENCEENFSQTEEFAGDVIDRRMYEIIRAAVRSFLQRHKALFDLRVKENKIREGHGDLRTDHIYLAEDGIQIIDCIEFNQRFRCSDIACDLAFLAMDLDFEGYSHVARRLLKIYIEESDDRDMMVLMDFYKCYRAFVRAKVNCFRLKQGQPAEEEEKALRHQVRRHVDLAYEYALLFSRPTIWVIFGMIASGKSTVAGELSDALQINQLRSDVIRKKLFTERAPQSSIPDFGEGMYRDEATSLTYGKLLLEAQEEIEAGNSVILDATFSRRNERRDVLRLSQDMDANIVFIECRCREEVIRQRLKKRADGQDTSDARLKHLDAFKDRYEAFDDDCEETLINIDTEKPLKENIADILARTA